MSKLESTRTLVHVESEPMYFIAGATMKFVSTPDDIRADLFLMEGSILPKAFVPLHEHRDPEIFHVLEGDLEFYVDSGGQTIWANAQPGDVLNIPGGVKHAFRNTNERPVKMMTVSGRKIYEFFREIVVPFDPHQPFAPPSSEQIQRLVTAAAKYGYWMASPEENAAIGLALPAPPA